MDFEAVSRYVVPYWHPLAVHAPLILLPMGAALAAVYAARGQAWMRWAALAVYLVAVPATWWAVDTGEALEHEVEGEPRVDLLLDTHEDAAEWSFRAGVLTLAVLAGGHVWVRRRAKPSEGATTPLREPVALRLLVLVPALVAAALVAFAGHVGGLMVWGVPR